MIKEAAIRGLSLLSVSCTMQRTALMFSIASLLLRGRSYTQGTIPLLNAALKLVLDAVVKRQVTEYPRNWLPTRHKRGRRVDRGVA